MSQPGWSSIQEVNAQYPAEMLDEWMPISKMQAFFDSLPNKYVERQCLLSDGYFLCEARYYPNAQLWYYPQYPVCLPEHPQKNEIRDTVHLLFMPEHLLLTWAKIESGPQIIKR